MLFDFGWTEILLIGTVALIFIGPKDLPKALRVAGYWVRKARTLSREFQSSIDQMIREAELDEMRQELKKVSEFDLDKEFQNTIDPTGDLRDSLKPPELPDFSAVAAEVPAARAEAEAIDGARASPAGTPAESAALGGTWPESYGTSVEPAAPVPMVAGPESEPDEMGAAQPAPPPEPGGPGVAAPKP
jgi:sec-independent protein translocase protein TatB